MSSVARIRGFDKKKMIEILMVDGVKLSSLSKKIGQSIHVKYFFGISKATKVIVFVLEMKYYYDVQKPKRMTRLP